jgi:hypothetical protein
MIQRADEETPHVSKIEPPERSPKGQPIPRREGALHTLLFSRNAAAPAVLFAIAFALYANTLSSDFALDDQLVITENVLVQKGIAGLVDIFSNDYLYGFMNKTSVSYRPLTLATYATEVSLAGSPLQVSLRRHLAPCELFDSKGLRRVRREECLIISFS